MDLVLFNHATAKSKPVVYLEPASKDALLLDKWMNAKAVKAILDKDDYGKKDIEDLLAAYQEGDVAKMRADAEKEKADALAHGYTPEEYDAEMHDMLIDRNASWIEPIEKLHQKGNGFIAVGALHLVGPQNVLEMLQAKGYTVTRVEPATPASPTSTPAATGDAGAAAPSPPN
jgi:uncharacterized protein YbaP (TraB family)